METNGVRYESLVTALHDAAKQLTCGSYGDDDARTRTPAIERGTKLSLLWRSLLQEAMEASPTFLSQFAGLGDKASAVKFLDKAYRQRSPDLVWYLKADPRIDNLRGIRNFGHRYGPPFSRTKNIARRCHDPSSLWELREDMILAP